MVMGLFVCQATLLAELSLLLCLHLLWFAGAYAFGAPAGFGAAAPAGGFNFGMQQ